MTYESMMLIPAPGDVLHVRTRGLVANRIRSVTGANHNHDAILCHSKDGKLSVYNERWPHSRLDVFDEYIRSLNRAGGSWVLTRPKWAIEQDDWELHDWRMWISVIARAMEGNYYPISNIWAVYKAKRKWARWVPFGTPNDKAYFCSAAVRQIMISNKVNPWVPAAVKDEALAAPIHWARAVRDGDMRIIAHYGRLIESIGDIQ